MKVSGTGRFWLLLAFLSTAPGAFAVNGGSSPYSAIVDRNAFDLKPIDPPPPPVTNAPPSNIKLTGFATFSTPRRAFLVVQASAGQPEKSCILSEGERDGAVEVLAINEKEGTVKVNNGGDIVTLNFEKDGAEAPPAPRVVPVPAPVPVIPPPSGAPAAQVAQAPEVHVQEVMIEVNRQRYIDSGDPRAKLLPPTSLTPMRDDNQQQQ